MDGSVYTTVRNYTKQIRSWDRPGDIVLWELHSSGESANLGSSNRNSFKECTGLLVPILTPQSVRVALEPKLHIVM